MGKHWERCSPFYRCVFHTLLHSVVVRGNGQVFVRTGDIPVRHTVVKMSLHHACANRRCGSETLQCSWGCCCLAWYVRTRCRASTHADMPQEAMPVLRSIVEGGIRQLAHFIQYDPWANAFSINWRPMQKLSRDEKLLGAALWWYLN